ncbi:MAG: hypothetical protein R3C05_12700 [Pirellulaceae bacterium]
MVGRFPICFLRLDMPSDFVDVNVHPTKLEVRFTDSGKIYSQLLQTLRHKFLTSDLTARVGRSQPTPPADTIDGPEAADDLEQSHRQNVIQWARSGESSTVDPQNVRPSIESGF